MIVISEKKILRFGLGGQALPCGVMMRSGGLAALTVRCKNGELLTRRWRVIAPGSNQLMRIRVIRGFAEVAGMAAFSLRGIYETLRLLPKTGIALPFGFLRYHGAEHKVLHCYENGLELSGENAMDQSRIHPRCGTVLVTAALIAELIVLLIVPRKTYKTYTDAIILISFLLGAAAGYEVSRRTASGGRFIRALSRPGLWAQRLTTREPGRDELECAVTAARAALGQS